MAVVEGERPPQHRRPILPQVRVVDDGVGEVLDHNTDLRFGTAAVIRRSGLHLSGNRPQWHRSVEHQNRTEAILAEILTVAPVQYRHGRSTDPNLRRSIRPNSRFETINPAYQPE